MRIALTDKALTALKPKPSRYEIQVRGDNYDGRLSGNYDGR